MHTGSSRPKLRWIPDNQKATRLTAHGRMTLREKTRYDIYVYTGRCIDFSNVKHVNIRSSLLRTLPGEREGL